MDIPKYKYTTRLGQLKAERTTWWAHWQELSMYLLPRSGRYFVQDRDKGYRRHNAIYDNTATRAVRALAAGMMSGLTSPARPWFQLSTMDKDMMKFQPVREWLDDVTKLMHTIYQRSNTYRALHAMYEELGVFGTSACIVLEDYQNVIHHYPLTIGEFCIATNWKGEVDTLYREFQKTTHELVREFGLDKVSRAARQMYENGNLDSWHTVIHVIEPNADRDPAKIDSKNMAWRSLYYQIDADPGTYLRESGFERFPALCPRWAISGGDIYGNSPGQEALGDVKQLQHEQVRKGEGIDQKIRPALQIPTSLKNREVETLPGGITYVDSLTPGGGIAPLFKDNIDLSHLLNDIQDVRDRIEKAFYADLFLMMANQQDARMTATEVAERHEEKLLMIGPVLERLQNELLDPLIEITFDRIMKAKIVPPPPPELRGHQLQVELVSMLAQAQRAIATNSIDRFVGSMGMVAQMKPEVLDKFDADVWADTYVESLGVTPRLLVPDQNVQALRQQRAQQQAQQQQAALANQGADTAKKLGQTPSTSQPSALGDITRQYSGYT